MSGNAEVFARLVIANVEQDIGPIEHASLTRLHLALADQIVFMVKADAIDDDIDPILGAVWQLLGERWAEAGGLPALTHRNKSGYVS